MNKSKFLVTGGAGFIGSNVALELEQQGHEVIIVDNLLTGAMINLEGFQGEFLNLDISRPFNLNIKIDVIIHQAGITDPRFKDDDEMIRANTRGFDHIIELARKNDAKLVYASTANLYGNGPVPMKESQKKEMISIYGQSKLEMDFMAEERFDQMDIVGLRYFNVFGPREQNKGRAASMVYHLHNQISDGKNPRLFEFGEQKRDLIYIKDVVEATIRAVDAPCGIYNVGTGVATSFNEVVNVLNEVLGKKLEPEYFEMPYDRASYQSNTQADTDLADKALGWKASLDLRDGVEVAIRHYRQHSLNYPKFHTSNKKNNKTSLLKTNTGFFRRLTGLLKLNSD